MSSATGNIAQSAKDKQQHLAESAGDMKNRLGDAGRQAMENTRSGAHAVQNTYNDLLREQPLMIGALAIAAGAALGAMLPRTQAEDSTVGEVSDKQKEGIKQQAEHRAEDLKQQAEHRAEDLKESATSSTHSRVTATPGSPAAGASGPPGSNATAGSAASTASAKEHTPVPGPSSVAGEPDTSPSDPNHRDDEKK